MVNVCKAARTYTGRAHAHHYLLDPSDQVCRCEGEPHHHGQCRWVLGKALIVKDVPDFGLRDSILSRKLGLRRLAVMRPVFEWAVALTDFIRLGLRDLSIRRLRVVAPDAAAWASVGIVFQELLVASATAVNHRIRLIWQTAFHHLAAVFNEVMRTTRDNLQVVGMIVLSVAVLVVDHFPSCQWSAKHLAGDKAVFIYPAMLICVGMIKRNCSNIAVSANVAPTSPVSVIRTTLEQRSTGATVSRLSLHGRAASGTDGLASHVTNVSQELLTHKSGRSPDMVCIHHWLIESDVCYCPNVDKPHFHARCLKECKAKRTYPVIVETTDVERMQALAVMMRIHHWDEAPKGGAV